MIQPKLKMEPTRRYLAHKVYHLGREYVLAVVEISHVLPRVRITPFEGETHSTSFHNGSIYILDASAGNVPGISGEVSPELITRLDLWYKNGHDKDSSQPFLLFV